MPGHKNFDLYPHDMAKAKKMIAEANPSDRDITVWTDAENPNNEAGQYYQGVLEELGFHVKLQEINADNYFTDDRQPDDARPRHGLVRLVPGLPAPERLLPTAALRRKHPADQQLQLRPHRRSRAQQEDQATGRRAARTAEQEAGYAELDREYMEQAPWAPYGTRTSSTFVSSAIDLDKVIYNPTFGDDLTSFQFK